MVLNKDLLAFLASIIFSIATVIIIRRLNLPAFVTFSIAIYTSYTLMFFVTLHNYISKSKKFK
ncbi:hypothetical protein NIES3585_06480 [Nodularia sp. NIES-3585]|nr:hypothetical protein NIES3585_06480 [Nodularia sp. NIES-3585]